MLESSLCPGLSRQCPGACRLGRCVEAEKRTHFFCLRKSRSSGVEGGGSRAVRRTAGTSSPGWGGVFSREKLIGNYRCEVLC